MAHRFTANEKRICRILWPKDASIATGQTATYVLYFEGILTTNAKGRYVLSEKGREELRQLGKKNVGKTPQ